jgi:uncharacterized coiled-coil protein SlyX
MKKFYDADIDSHSGGYLHTPSVKCPITDLPCRNPECLTRSNHCDLDRNPFSQKEMLRKTLIEMRQQVPECGPINVHIHNDFGPLLEVLLSINQKLNKTMATIEEVQQAVADLQATVDSTQLAIATAIKALEDQIAAGSAATPEQLQAVIDSLRAVQTDVSNTPTS